MWYRNAMKLTLNTRVSSDFQSPVLLSTSNTRKCFMLYPNTVNNMSNARRLFFIQNVNTQKWYVSHERDSFFSRYLSIEKQYINTRRSVSSDIPTVWRVEKTRRSRVFSRPTQGFCGSYGWTGVTYDWSIVSKVIHWPIIACIFLSTYPRNLCAES